IPGKWCQSCHNGPKQGQFRISKCKCEIPASTLRLISVMLGLPHAGRRRVLKASVDTFSLSGKHQAGLFRVVADRDHGVEFPPDELIHRFRPVAGNINADLPHYLNRLWPDAARSHPGAVNFKGVSAVVTENSLGHLAARGVSGAEN